MLKLRIPAATANLGCGYDTFGMALGYYNYLEFAEAEQYDLRIIGEGEGHLPRNNANLVVRAAAAAYELAGRSMPPLALTAHNNIPLSRGMGSSSSAIVAGIMAANTLMGDPLDRPALLELAAKLEGHPDNVAPAIYGGFTITAHEGGRLYCKKLTLPPQLRVLLAIPSFTVATKKARAILPRQVALTDAVFNISHAAYMAAALAEGDIRGFGAMLFDRLHQPYRYQLVRGAQDVADAAVAAGAIGCVLSGSGPTMAAFSEDDEPLNAGIAAAMSEAFARNGVSCRMMILNTDNRGAALMEQEEE
ncbi:MAG: homoserine kinase [Bacillota bacterium]|nr:homoserine kinase [Bacillota bacterium]